MLLRDQHPHNRSIMLSVLGAPNVGKSSLINCLIGIDLGAVSSRPQTTRNKYQCIFTIDRTEIILVDTPGLHKSGKEFNKRINQQAREGVFGTDLNLLLIDTTEDILQQFIDFQENFRSALGRTWAVFTKADLLDSPEKFPWDEVLEKARQVIPKLERYFVVSSKKGDNIHALTGAICDAAESGPHHYDEGAISNKNERFFVAEYIREQAFLQLKEELPYESAVVIDEFKDNKEKQGVTHISATILVNRPSQRAIVIGSKGSMIKEIGTQSRIRIEELLHTHVHLNLHVKVSPRWFKNNFVLEELGLPRAVDSNRYWSAK